MQYFPHQPIGINELTICFGNKECIRQPFTSTIYYGHRIGIVGRNGSGKSSLIKVISGLSSSYDGDIFLPKDVIKGYIPQLNADNDNSPLSGGQRFNHHLSQALSSYPNLLLLDEPTNHLDSHNRTALFGWLKRYHGTLITITHDLELLNFVDIIWHVANGCITVFNGSYSEYMLMQQQELANLTDAVHHLNSEKKLAHQQLMKEQQRAKHSRLQGEKHIKQRKWPTVGSPTKAGRGVTTAGKNTHRIERNKQIAVEGLQQLYVPEVIIPKFNLSPGKINASKIILSIENGSCGYLTNYAAERMLLTQINLQISSTEKVVLFGINGSGKSTLVKAILNQGIINRDGYWVCPNSDDIGYVDQNYSNLNPNSTATQLMQEVMPTCTHAEIRQHLNMFLLRKNEEVNLAVKYLSGGERVRLNLAIIAAKPPKLLILDEITNNVDLETKEHLIQVLNKYPASIILICHDQGFVNSLSINTCYNIQNGRVDRG